MSAVSGDLTGYVQGDVASARTMIEPLMAAFQIDCRESGAKLVFSSRAKVSSPPRVIDVLADFDDKPLWSETRAQESDVAAQATLDYYDEAGDYESAVARSRRMAAGNDRVASARLPACWRKRRRRRQQKRSCATSASPAVPSSSASHPS